MAVPKEKHSKSRTKQRRVAYQTRKTVVAVKTKDGKAYKRPHIEEYIEV